MSLLSEISFALKRQHIKKQRHYFANKSPSSQSYGFSSSRVWMPKLDYKESRVPKNWCFWTVVFEKTLESSLDCKEIQEVHPKGNQSWIFIGRTNAEAETPIFGYLMQRTDSFEKTLMLGKIEGRRRREWQRMRWLDGLTNSMDISLSKHREIVKGVGDGQGGLVYCSPWSLGESDMTERLNWTDWKWFWLPRWQQWSIICLPMQETQETQVLFLGWEDPLEKGMATHSIILTWRIPGTEEPGVLQSRGSHRVGHNWRDLAAAACWV